MAARSYVSDNLIELQPWLQNFAPKLATHAAALSVTAAEVASVNADLAVVTWLVKVQPLVRTTAQQLTAYKVSVCEGQTGPNAQALPTLPTLPTPPAAVLDGIIPRTRTLVARIKKSPGYTEAIGKDLGIIAPDDSGETTTKPTFKAVVLPSYEVRLDWVKGRHSGVLVQCKRPGDADFITLGQDNYSPYVDGRPPVTAGANETRQYRMRYLDKDDQVGDWSDVVTAVAAP
jgi:hypothetical protein